MSLDQTFEEEIRMEQELREVSERLIQQEGINNSDIESFIKLVEGKVKQSLQSVVETTLEDLIRTFAKEVIDAAFEQILNGNPANEFRPLQQRRLLLKFKYKLLKPIWTGVPLKNIEIALFDSLSGEIINSGPESSANVEIVLIKSDENCERELSFEEFNQNIIREGEENKPLLNENVFVHLKEGIGRVGEFKFKHGSKYMKNSRFRLGARMADTIYRARVREAVSESFEIKDRRNKLYEKHEIPSLSDKVLHLKNISKRGAFYRCLKEHDIETVKGFLIENFTNPHNFQEIIGNTISGEKLKETVAHALKCSELNDRYIYYSNCASHKITAVTLNVVGQIFGAFYQSHYIPFNMIQEDQKIEAHELVITALNHWEKAIPIDKNFPNFDTSDIQNYATTSHGLESFEPRDDDVLIMNDNHENDVSCNTYQGFTSSNISDWSGNIADDIGTSSTYLMYDPSYIP